VRRVSTVAASSVVRKEASRAGGWAGMWVALTALRWAQTREDTRAEQSGRLKAATKGAERAV